MKIVIWLQNANPGRGGVELLNPAAQILQKLYGNLNTIGFISESDLSVIGVKRLAKEDLKNIDFDLILVTGSDIPMIVTNTQSNFVKILKEAKSLGIDEDKIVLDRVICVPNFTLEKYKKLRHSKLSILSTSCFGGFCYHRFGLPFLSPTINMFTSDKEFLKFLQNPMENVHKELIFQGTAFEKKIQADYPIFKVGETKWYMNHYPNFDVAYRKWYERTFRINWFNVLPVMFTENPEVLAEFDKLPFAKKVCFVPFKSDLYSAYYIDSSRYINGDKFFLIVNGMGSGSANEYDMWDMLLYGKKN
jgi:uncharacterized protein (DUF1919 family)